MKRVKFILALTAALALLGGALYGYSAPAGSSGDPLITRSFANGDYAEQVLTQAEEKIASTLEESYNRYAAGLSGGGTGAYRAVNMLSGGEISLPFGGSAILRSGAATLHIKSGEVIDLTEGVTVASGAVQTGHRYLAAEGAEASLRFNTAALVLLGGPAAVLSGQGTDGPFTDIQETNWFYADVLGAVEMGLIDGYEDGTFRPQDTVTYAQVIKLAACAHQRYHAGAVTLENGSPWYRSYADYALANGIIAAEPADFNAACSRAYFAAVLYNALPDREYGARNSIGDGAVPDVGMDHPYAAEIYAFYRAGILPGMDDAGRFEPESNVKRSEVATILARMFDPAVRRDVAL